MEKDTKINEVIEELKKSNNNNELVQDNKLVFKYDKKYYRVRMPSYLENNNANEYKNKTYVKLLQQDNMVVVDKLKKILKKKQGIDIAKIDRIAEKLEKEITDLYIDVSCKYDAEKEKIEELKKKIDELSDKRLQLVLKKAEYLSPAIEYQAQDAFYHYLTAQCTEVRVKTDVWERVWKSCEDYEKDNSKLRYIALGKFTDLMYGI